MFLSSSDNSDINVLSFDGGGTRGIMEVMILDDIMKLYTIIKTEPQKLMNFVDSNTEQDDKIFKKENLEEFNTLLHKVNPNENLVHPTDVFDVICGTSTGALISFGLIAGNNGGRKRSPMSLKEVKDLYHKAVPGILTKVRSNFITAYDDKRRIHLIHLQTTGKLRTTHP